VTCSPFKSGSKAFQITNKTSKDFFKKNAPTQAKQSSNKIQKIATLVTTKIVKKGFLTATQTLLKKTPYYYERNLYSINRTME